MKWQGMYSTDKMRSSVSHVFLLLLLVLLRLSCSDSVQGAGLAGGRAGREEGPHPRELRGDAVAAAATDTADDGNIY